MWPCGDNAMRSFDPELEDFKSLSWRSLKILIQETVIGWSASSARIRTYQAVRDQT